MDLEFKANFENNDGEFLNPEANVPTDGLYSSRSFCFFVKRVID